MTWINQLVGKVLLSNPFCIIVEFHYPNDNIITVVGVYLSCDFNTRSSQLDFISNFCSQLKVPFVICGDFNATLSFSEKSSFFHSSNNNENRSIDNFQQFVNRLSLTDLSPSGPLFTWTNRQTYEVKSRLDRFLLSPSWIKNFPRSTVQHLSDNGSDHRAIFLLNNQNSYGPKKYFYFDQRWLSNLEADSIISNSWQSPVVKGSKLFIFHSKLKFLRHNLVAWQKSGSSNSARKIKSLKDEINRAKAGPPTNWESIHNLERKLEHELRLEDSYWKTKARNQWILQGDRNTKYFHRIASFNRNKLHIAKLKDDNGNFRTSEEEKQQLAIDYFKRLFSSDIPPGFFPSSALSLPIKIGFFSPKCGFNKTCFNTGN
ncbi:hypothetical protein LINGRAPRIM_LOCUS443 [Linum grandiflorum]